MGSRVYQAMDFDLKVENLIVFLYYLSLYHTSLPSIHSEAWLRAETISRAGYGPAIDGLAKAGSATGGRRSRMF